MSASYMVGLLVCGAFVGLFSRYVLPGRPRLGIALPVFLGVLGAAAGAFLYWGLQSLPGSGSLFSAVWPGWILAFAGSVCLLWFYNSSVPRTWLE